MKTIQLKKTALAALMGSATLALGWCAPVPAVQAQTPTAAQIQADPASLRGKTLYESRCGACHSVDANRVGPAHQGVLGRRAGTAPDYAYSKALANSKLVWTRANLLAWLTEPERLIPGQAMNYSLGDAAERADVVGYLATLSAPKAASQR